MERTDVLELMSRLKLYGMRAAYDEVMTTAIKRRHEPPRIVGDLLAAEIAEKQARSIKYQLTIVNYRWLKTSMTSTLPARRSTRRRSVTWRAAAFSPGSATPCWSAAPAPASRISP
jgi:hypothetical protein